MATANQVMSSRAKQNSCRLLRLQMLIIDGGLLILRNIFNQKLQNYPLVAFLKNEKQTITNLRSRGIITQVQYKLLFPLCGSGPTTTDLDITLIICLLRNIMSFGLNKNFQWNSIPSQGDTSVEADITRLKIYRNELSHISSTSGITLLAFTKKWTQIEQVLLRLNTSKTPVPHLQKMIDDFKVNPLDPQAEERVQKAIDSWQMLEKGVEADLKLIKMEEEKMKCTLNVHGQIVRKHAQSVEELNKKTAEHNKQIHDHTKQLQELKEETRKVSDIELMKKQITEIQETFENHGLSTKVVNTVFGSLRLSALEQRTVDEAERVLLLVSKESLSHSESSQSHKTVRETVDDLVQDMNDKDLEIVDVSEGSIVFTIKCKSFEHVVILIDYFNSPKINNNLDAISCALSEVTGQKIEIHAMISSDRLSEELRRHKGMAVSGRKQSDLLGSVAAGSTDDFNYCCEPCLTTGQRIEAHGFCGTCQEYLCSTCIDCHSCYESPQKLKYVDRLIGKGDIIVKTSSDNGACYTTGCAVFNTNILVLADNSNKKIKLISIENRLVQEEKALDSKPWDIAAMSQDQFAVTMPNIKEIVVMTTDDKLSCVRSIKVDRECYGIDFNQDCLYVACLYPPSVIVLNTQGDILNNIPLNFHSSCYIPYIAVGKDSKLLYISDCGNNSITSVSLQGEVTATYKHTDLRGPWGMLMLDDRSLLVCCFDDGTIHKVNGKLKKGNIMCKGVIKPRSICYSANNDEVYVGCSGTNLKVFSTNDE